MLQTEASGNIVLVPAGLISCTPSASLELSCSLVEDGHCVSLVWNGHGFLRDI
jgi:hypothetical protein